MSTIIIAIVAVVLVAILAIAGVYYGGNITQHKSEQAKIAQYINQASQVASAVQLYRTNNAGAAPAKISDLVSAGYLRSVPDGSWAFANGAVTRSNINTDECKLINERLNGTKTIPECSTVDAGFAGCCTPAATP